MEQFGPYLIPENVKTWSDAQWLINEMENSYKKYFPKSFFAARLGTGGLFRGTISVHFSLGQKGEYENNIFENDPMPHKILIRGFDENGELVKPKAEAETATGGALFITPPEGSRFAYETVKFGWRKISGDVNTIARRMDKYFEKVYNTVRDNIDKIPPQKAYDVRKKI